MRSFTIPAAKTTTPPPFPRQRKGMKIGKKLESVEEAYCRLSFRNAKEAEATFKELARARGVSEATYSKRWAIVWALVQKFCSVIACEKAVAS